MRLKQNQILGDKALPIIAAVLLAAVFHLFVYGLAAADAATLRKNGSRTSIPVIGS